MVQGTKEKETSEECLWEDREKPSLCHMMTQPGGKIMNDKIFQGLELLLHCIIYRISCYHYFSSGSSTPRFDDLRKTTPRYDESGRATPRSNSSLSTYGMGNRQSMSGRLPYGLSSNSKSPRSSGSGRESMRSTPRTNTSPHSMVESSLSGDATPLYDEN